MLPLYSLLLLWSLLLYALWGSVPMPTRSGAFDPMGRPRIDRPPVASQLTPEPEPTATDQPTSTPVPSIEPSPTTEPTVEPSPTGTPQITATPTDSATGLPTPGEATPTYTPTNDPAASATSESTSTPTATNTPTTGPETTSDPATSTPAGSETPTSTPVLSETPAVTTTEVLLATPTITPTITPTPGDLLISDPDVPSFPNVKLNGSAQSVSVTFGAFTVSDLRGTGEGWRVIVGASQFAEYNASTGTYIEGGKRLPQGSLRMSQITLTGMENSDTTPHITDGPHIIDRDSNVEIARVDQGTGTGVYHFGATTLTLTIPPSAYARTYHSDVTLSIVSGP